MAPLALLLKSYADDFTYARRLLTSFREHNSDGLPLHCVVPTADVPLFESLRIPELIVSSEEDVAGAHLVTESVGGIRTGYVNQEIVKLAFWETGLAENYFCVDSDAVFLRDFYFSDFMRDETTPYSVLVQDKDLQSEPHYFDNHWQGREAAIRSIMDAVGLDDPIMRTSHGHQVMSSQVLKSLRDDFMSPRGYGYRDLLSISPYEFSWYAMWLQAARPIPIHQIEPLVKVFHNEDQYVASLVAGQTEKDLAQAYVGLVINSNFSRHVGMLDLSTSREDALAKFLTFSELRRIAARKISRAITH